MTAELNYLKPIHLGDAKQTKISPYQQTASGYGSKLQTSYMIQLVGHSRWYRVYCMCYSNSGSCYIVRKGVTYFTSRIESKMQELVKH